MTTATDLDALRRQATLSSLAGFPFLLVYSAVWVTAGALSYVPPTVAPDVTRFAVVQPIGTTAEAPGVRVRLLLGWSRLLVPGGGELQ